MCGINAIFAYGAGAPPVDRDERVTVRDMYDSVIRDEARGWAREVHRRCYGASESATE